MDNNKLILYNHDLLNDETFLSFLKYQIKGVFENNLFCDYNLHSIDCLFCTKNFIKHSEFHKYFENLYDWFKQENFKPCCGDDNKYLYHFFPSNIIECFKSIYKYLTPEQAFYFCSPWLDGMFVLRDKSTTSFDILNLLCLQGYFETLQWICKEPNITLNISDQQNLFINLCKYKLKGNKNISNILSWLYLLNNNSNPNINHNSNPNSNPNSNHNSTNNHDILDYKKGFQYACSSGQLEVIQWLSELQNDQKIDIIACGEEAFKTACSNGQLEVIQWLLKLEGEKEINVHHGNDISFILACQNGQLEVVKYLLNLEKDRLIDFRTINYSGFLAACQYGHLEMVKLFLSLSGDRTINVHVGNESGFCLACRYGHLELIKLFLSLSGDRFIENDSLNKYALKEACGGKSEHLEVIKFLLSLSGDRTIDVHVNREEPFQIACRNGHLKIVKLLLALKDRVIDVHARDEAAFKGACENGHLNIVKWLLGLKGNRKIDIHINNEEAFRLACHRNRLDVVSFLLKLKEDRLINTNINNKEVFRFADLFQNLKMKKLLQKFQTK